MRYQERQEVGPVHLITHLYDTERVEVYYGLHRETQEPVVFQILRPELQNDSEFLSLYQESGRILPHLQNPNLVKVLSVGEDHGVPFQVQEYLAGDPLHLVLANLAQRKENMPVTALVRCFLQLANGLTRLHDFRDSQGQLATFVFRDLSPQSVFLCFDGRVKLLDFGIPPPEVDFVRTGVLRSQLAYLSPEEIQGLPIDFRADYFSMGAMLWECAVGEKLFEADNEFEVMRLIRDKEIERPSQRRKDIDPELERILLRCLQREPSQRYQTGNDIRRELSKRLTSASGRSDPNEFDRWMESILDERRRKKEGLLAELTPSNVFLSNAFADLGDGLVGSADRTRIVPCRTTLSLPPDSRETRLLSFVDNSPKANTKNNQALRVVGWLLGGLLVTAGLVVAFVLFPQKTGDELSPAETYLRELRKADLSRLNDIVNTPSEQIPILPVPAPSLPATKASAPHPETPDKATTPSASAVVGSNLPSSSDDPTGKELGYLELTATPPCNVYIDGSFVGNTPLRAHQLKPGRYLVVLENPRGGEKKTLLIRIQKDEIVSHAIRF